MTDRLLPSGFHLAIDPGARRPRREVLVGGAPIRVLRLTPAGAALLDRWSAGAPVGSAPGARRLATRLVDAGLAHPRPVGPAPPPEVTVVVPVRDDPDGLDLTLASLAGTAPGVSVLVVDDGSEPPVRPPGGDVGLLRRPTSEGPAAARNRGWQQSGPGVVVFVDAGCVVAPGWRAGLEAHFADPGLGAVAPRVLSRPAPGAPPGLASYEAAHSPLDMGPVEGPVRPGAAVPYVPTAVLAVRTEALAGAGGFDEALRFGEDVDLVWRLGKAGWRVRYDPTVSATHPVRPTRRRWARQRFDYGRSATALAARHGRAVAPLTVSPWSVAVWTLLAVGRPLSALALTAGSAAALARRAGPDVATAAELGRLALTGHARAGAAIAGAIRRAWLPVAAPSAALAWRLGGPRVRVGLALSIAAGSLGPGLHDWRSHRPPVGPLTWSGWRLADDLAYQTGVWSGVLKARSIRALLPRW